MKHSENMILPVDFYNRPVLEVARAMLGKRLVHQFNGMRLAGEIIETEAYGGMDDLACHARSGLTPRTAVMFGPPGKAYIYLNYGMHWLMNCVAEPEGQPAAVLIRALVPVEGLEQIAQNRAGRAFAEWCSGPARLTKALAIDGSFNNTGLCAENGLWIEDAPEVSEALVRRAARVGIDRVPEPWKSIPWRFLLVRENGDSHTK